MQSRRRFIVAGIVGSAFGIAGCSSDGDTGGGDTEPRQTPSSETFVDDRTTAEEDEYRYWEFTLSQQAYLNLDVTVRDGPAVDVYLTEPDEFAEYEQENRFYHNGDVSLLDVTADSSGSSVTAGDYVLILDNTNAGEAVPPANLANDIAEVEIELVANY